MTEKPDLFPYGYGRGWREPKVSGVARIFQMGREPATKTTWCVLCGFHALVVLAAILAA